MIFCVFRAKVSMEAKQMIKCVLSATKSILFFMKIAKKWFPKKIAKQSNRKKGIN